MSSDELIREAYAALAETAPHPDRVRARLTGRARAYRQRRALLIGAGAAAAAFPFAMLLQGGGPAGDPAGSPLRSVAFTHTPAWLPEGAEPVQRSTTGATQQRTWRVGDKGRVDLLVNHPLEQPAFDWQPVQIGQISGRLHAEEKFAIVQWGDNVEVRVGELPDPGSIAVRIAASVSAQAVEETPVAVEFDWLPARIDHQVTHLWANHEYVYTDVVVAEVVGQPTLPGGDEVAVRGTTGRYVSPPAGEKPAIRVDLGGLYGMVIVPLGDGRWLEVRNIYDNVLSRDELVQIAESVRLGL